MSLSVCLIVGRRTLITHAPILGDGYKTSSNSRSIAYNYLNKPKTLVSNDITVEYKYGPDDSRYFQSKLTPAGTVENYYLSGGAFEEEKSEGTIIQKSYVDGVLIDKRSDEVFEQIYVLRDHIGSVVLTTDSSVTGSLENSIIDELSYEPFGARTDTWREPTDEIPLADDRGFTDHEHIDDFGLIHMNGRLYDPAIGRFLSADFFVQSPSSVPCG